ncbi:hypothetical protein ACFLX8_04890 [Chloroflexota bacterium]
MNEETIKVFADKECFYKMCLEQGVELPVTYFPQNLRDVKSFSQELCYPCIIKPSFPHLWRRKLRGAKVIHIRNPQELISEYERIHHWDKHVVIQEVIPGEENRIFIFGGYFNKNSEPLAVFTGRKLRQFPPKFGSASLAESVWKPEIAEMSITLLKKLKFSGICGTEYKLDPRDNRFKMMEINQRHCLWCSLIEASGVPFTYVSYRDLIGDPLSVTYRQTEGIKRIYTARDIASSFSYMFSGELTLGDWYRSVRHKKIHAILAYDDIQPAVMQPICLAIEFWEYFLKHRN